MRNWRTQSKLKKECCFRKCLAVFVTKVHLNRFCQSLHEQKIVPYCAFHVAMHIMQNVWLYGGNQVGVWNVHTAEAMKLEKSGDNLSNQKLQ
jgi:hypothetical protein